MEVFDAVYAFLTKRNIAVDQITSKYVNKKYRIEIQVAQFDRNHYFWGVEILADHLIVVNPRDIIKKRAIWILEYEFEFSPKSIIFYSVQRPQNYGKKCYRDSVPKDAII